MKRNPNPVHTNGETAKRNGWAEKGVKRGVFQWRSFRNDFFLGIFWDFFQVPDLSALKKFWDFAMENSFLFFQ